MKQDQNQSPMPPWAAELLRDARVRTLLLISPVGAEELRIQHDPLMSPIIWDLGHIAHFEELWMLHNLDGPIEFVEMPGMYNPFENPRATRAGLPLPSVQECVRMMAGIRGRVIGGFDRPAPGGESELLQDGYVYRMVAQHEYQHNETILQTLQLKKGTPYAAPRAFDPPPARPIESGMVRFPGGTVHIGTDDRSAAYDNERPRHERELESFRIDAAPVSNGAFLEFMNNGGYTERDYWSEAGWHWLQDFQAEAPKYWHREGAEWHTRVMDLVRPVDLQRPVCHVCYHEADAFARWAGKRLPTETEWEAAASWDPETGTQRLFPWGDEPPSPLDANLDQLAFDTAPAGAYPRNVSPIGCYGMIGDVWEWTSSDFTGYPGYRTFPYKEYSEEFFGTEYKVLRGGSWATRPGAIRTTFRNWDYPIRRQIFAGFRCAQDD